MTVRPLAFVIAVFLVLAHARLARAAEVDLVASQMYAKNDSVKVEVHATGDVLLTSDFDLASRTERVMGSKVIDVGKVTGPAFARITVSDASEEVFLDVLVVPEGAKFRFIVTRGKVARKRTEAVRTQEQSILDKLVKGIDKPKVTAGLRKAAVAWAGDNAVDLGTTTVVCLLTIAEPVAARYCKAGAVDAAGALGITFLEKLVDEVEGHGLEKAEADVVRTWIKLGKTLAIANLDKKSLEELDELLGKLSSVIGEIEFKNEKVKVLAKTGVDVTHKYVLILKIAKP